MKPIRAPLFQALSPAFVLVALAACSSNVDLADRRATTASGSGGSSQDGEDSGASTGGTTTASGGSSGAATASGGSPSGAGGGPAPFCSSPTCTIRDLRPVHATIDSQLPWNPGEEGDQCYGLHFDTGSFTQATAIEAILDNTLVVHDMELIKTPSPQTNGSSWACFDAVPPGASVWVWEPGTGVVPVSFQVPGSDGGSIGDYVLRVHYVNATDSPQHDDSGALLCACLP